MRPLLPDAVACHAPEPGASVQGLPLSIKRHRMPDPFRVVSPTALSNPSRGRSRLRFMVMHMCPRCGEENPDRARFCLRWSFPNSTGPSRPKYGADLFRWHLVVAEGTGRPRDGIGADRNRLVPRSRPLDVGGRNDRARCAREKVSGGCRADHLDRPPLKQCLHDLRRSRLSVDAGG
jgi:hypothetical protein